MLRTTLRRANYRTTSHTLPRNVFGDMRTIEHKIDSVSFVFKSIGAIVKDKSVRRVQT